MTVPRKKYLIYDWTSQTLEREKMSIICSWRAHSFCLWTARQCNSERFMWCCWEEKNRLWNSYSCIDANLFQFNLFHLKKKNILFIATYIKFTHLHTLYALLSPSIDCWKTTQYKNCTYNFLCCCLFAVPNVQIRCFFGVYLSNVYCFGCVLIHLHECLFFFWWMYGPRTKLLANKKKSKISTLIHSLKMTTEHRAKRKYSSI